RFAKLRRMMHRPARRRKRWLLGGCLGGLLLGGCPTRFDPRAEPVAVSASDPAAREAYHRARTRLGAGDYRAGAARFREFRAAFPNDPLAQSATLWEARADLGAGDSATAQQLVEPLSQGQSTDPVAERARFVLGLSLARSEKKE